MGGCDEIISFIDALLQCCNFVCRLVQVIMLFIVYNFVFEIIHDVHNFGFSVCINKFDMVYSR